MKTPLTLNESEIIATANDLFGTSFVSVDFLPVGESSWIYIAKDASGQKSILKMQTTYSEASSEILQLLADNAFRWAPKIRLSKNNTIWAQANNLYFSVQQYIPSDTLLGANSTPDNHYLMELGEALKDLHSITVQPEQVKNVPVENFEPTMVSEARTALKRFQNAKAATEPVATAQGCMAAESARIEQLFQNITAYGTKLKGANPKLCIVHGDFHFGNVIQPDDRHLYLVDWDQSMIAMREHDLMYFTDDQIAQLSKGYGEDLMQNTMAIQYYRNYLLIRAIGFWLNKLLGEASIEQQATAATIVDVFGNSPYMVRALQ